jgi:hypothetical protein
MKYMISSFQILSIPSSDMAIFFFKFQMEIFISNFKNENFQFFHFKFQKWKF